ncbi:ACIN1 isoform 6, partial [Pan troglodytes]
NDDRPEGSVEDEEKKEYLMYGNPPVKYNPAQLANR